jgi:hypothetical protein
MILMEEGTTLTTRQAFFLKCIYNFVFKCHLLPRMTTFFFLLFQKRRNESARYTFVYLNAIKSLRSLTFDEGSKSIPLEYFEWERVIVDEIHECLCTSKDDIKLAKEATNEEDRGFFQEKNRRAGRELLGVMTKDTKMRPLVFRRAIFGLTGTPLLDRYALHC